MQKLPTLLLLCLGLGVAGAIALAGERSGDGALSEAISEHADEIYRGPGPVVGDPDGAVPIVLFTDFNCPDCESAEPAIERLIEEEEGIRLIVKPLPVLGPDSEIAARIALAADAQGKYWPLHKALFEASGRVTQKRALRIAKDAGLDLDRLIAEANGEAVTETLGQTFLLADGLEVPGVPFILVGDRRVSEGGDLYADLVAALKDVRASGCAAC